MQRLKIMIALLFVMTCALALSFSLSASSQNVQRPSNYPDTALTAAQSAALASHTNQADKVSNTGVTVSGQPNNAANSPANIPNDGTGLRVPFPSPTPDPCPGIDCEDSDPGNWDTFTFASDDGARPPAADACPTPRCQWPMDCPQPICDPENMPHAAEAPAAFDDHTNSEVFLPQGGQVSACPSPGPTPGTFEADKFIFSVVDDKEKGLGPVYNAQSCRECHQNPVTGGISQFTELRAGHNDANNNFIDAPGGSLINDRAIDSKIQERVPPLFTAGIVGNGPPIASQEPVRTFRTSLNLLGDGFVEAVSNGTLLAISNAQAAQTGGVVHGQAIAVPVLEANFQSNRDCANSSQPCVRRIGRFGWKDQVPSLLSFSGDAYINEIGITNFLILTENTSHGRFVGFGSGFDMVSDSTPCNDTPGITCGEDKERDIDTFTAFMRATKAPPQDKDIQNDPRYAADIAAGRQFFAQMPSGPSYSCSVCHVPAILTAQPGTFINGGQFAVPDNLGFKVLRPFSDFLLHDVGTGDGIVQNGGQTTRNKLRTPALWGMRTRTRFMHDGESLTMMDAISRHHGEADAVRAGFNAMTQDQQRQLIMFLESL